MMIFIIQMLYVLSILSCLNDMEDLHVYMLILSFKCCWKYALIMVNYAGINSKYLLKPLYLQQFRKPIFQ